MLRDWHGINEGVRGIVDDQKSRLDTVCYGGCPAVSEDGDLVCHHIALHGIGPVHQRVPRRGNMSVDKREQAVHQQPHTRITRDVSTLRLKVDGTRVRDFE